MLYRFGPHTLDTEARELSREGTTIHLPPKPYTLLEELLTAHPRALSKQELLETLWPDHFVSEASLARVVSELRQALADDGESQGLGPIRTVHGFGYSIREVEEVEGGDRQPGGESGHLLISEEGRTVLHAGDNILGRAIDARVVLDDVKASRQHCVIRVRGDVALLEDLGSKNGTRLCGEPVDSPVELQELDVIEVGNTSLTYRKVSTEATVTQTV